MLNFFETIIEFFSLLFEWISNIVKSLFMLVTLVSETFATSFTFSGFLWAPLGACALAVTAIGVLKIIIGRSSI